MPIRYRSENGRRARGVSKHFSEEYRQVLRDRLAKARQARADKRAQAEREAVVLAAHVKAMAALGKFVPVSEREST